MDETREPTHDHPTDDAPTRRRVPGRRGPSRRRAAPALALGLAVVLSGAATLAVTSAGDDGGGSGGDGGASAPAGDRSAQQGAASDFADCMRDHGIEDFPDPEVDEDGGISIGDAVADQRDTAEFAAAEEECEPLLAAATPAPDGPKLPADQVGELQEQWLAVADCVRAQGYDIDDPQVDDYGRPQVRADGPGVEQAIEECLQQSDLGRPPGAGA